MGGVDRLVRLQVWQALPEQLVREVDALGGSERVGWPGLLARMVVPGEDAHQCPCGHHLRDRREGEGPTEFGTGEFAGTDEGEGHEGGAGRGSGSGRRHAGVEPGEAEEQG